MKRLQIVFIVTCALVIAGLSCARTRSSSPPSEKVQRVEFEHDGLLRSYLLVEPTDVRPEAMVPLVLALHGGGGDAQRMCSLMAGIQTMVDPEQILVVCPQGVEGHWNDGRRINDYRAHREGVDDVGFLLAVVDRIQLDYPIDPARIFATGYSNGGMMSFRLACEAADRLAAAAAGIANLPADLECNPAQPISMMVLNGTEDPLMPYEGGQVHFGRRQLGEVLSTDRTIRFWAEANGCDPEPSLTQLPVQDATDDTRIRKEQYSNCHNGAEVVLYVVEGGGHTWPGGSQYLPASIIGKVSHQANAAELIWRFFEDSPI